MIAQAPKIVSTLSNIGLIDIDKLNIDAFNDLSTSKEALLEVFKQGQLSSYDLSYEFSTRFGSPLMDLSVFDPNSFPEEELIDLKLVEKHLAMPIFRRGKTLFVATVDPTDKTALEELKFATSLRIFPIQVGLNDFEKLVEQYLDANSKSLDDMMGESEFELNIEGDGDDEGNSDAIEAAEDDAPIVKYVNKLLLDAINKGASDIHIEPFEKELRVRMRIDGILHKVATQPIAFAPRIAARIKIISKLDIAERRAPQDGRVKLKIAKNKAFDFRVNTLPTVYGEKVVMRLLDSSAANLELTTLGFTDEQLDLYKDVVKRPYGMVLITGPTGSGKTVTLYSALNMLNDPGKNISTVEDPVEIQLFGITQVNINEKANLGFADALRAFLRQDPDILMLGEIRDLETAEIAIKASQTGHMVLSTLHTNDAPSTLTRLLNMGVPAFNVASAVQLIVAQRLVRRLCTSCKTEISLPEKALIDAGFKPEDIGKFKVFGPNLEGCANCTEGYKGRAGVYQVMPISERIKTLIMEGCTENDIEDQAEKEGTLDLRQAGLVKVKEGLTSLEEIERVTNV